MNTLKVKGTKAFIWDFFGKLATHGSGFIVSIFLARLLAPEDFGLIAMIMVIVSIAQVFTDVGLGSALIQRRRVLAVHYSSVFYFNIFIGAVLTLITFLSAQSIANFYDNQLLLPLTQVISFSFLINSFGSIQSSKLRKELNYQEITKASFLASLFSGIVGVVMAYSDYGIWSLVSQILLFEIFYVVLIWKFSSWKPILEFSHKALVQLWGFGFRMFLAAALNEFFARLDFIVIGKLFPPATLGFFQRAKSLNSMVIQYSSGSLMSVLFPLLSKVQKDLPRFQHIILKGLGLINFVVFLLLGSLYLVSEELIVILFGDKWISSAEYFKIMIMSGFSYPISSLLVSALSSRGNSKDFLQLEILKKVLLIFSFTILFYYGILSYMYSLVFTAILAVTLNVYYVSKEIHLKKLELLLPMIKQMLITVISVSIVLIINLEVYLGDFMMLLIKDTEFLFIYLLINISLKVGSYQYFMDEFKPLLVKLYKKVKY